MEHLFSSFTACTKWATWKVKWLRNILENSVLTNLKKSQECTVRRHTHNNNEINTHHLFLSSSKTLIISSRHKSSRILRVKVFLVTSQFGHHTNPPIKIWPNNNQLIPTYRPKCSSSQCNKMSRFLPQVTNLSKVFKVAVGNPSYQNQIVLTSELFKRN